jgi:hypothetical protein
MALIQFVDATRCETLDPNGKSWGAFMDLGPEDQAILEKILTPHAFRALICLEENFEHLVRISNQIFTTVPIFTLTAGSNVIKPLQGAGARSRYSLCFHLIQHMMLLNRQRLSQGISDHSELINTSIAFCKDSRDKLMGFNLYLRYTDPTTIGEELVFAFFHHGMRKVALIAVPGETHRDAALKFIGSKSILLPFDKVCAWCGRAAEDLKKCPCKAVRYCNSDCQRLHWDMHILECRR